MTIFYSDEEPLSKYFPVMLHLSLATRMLYENSGAVKFLKCEPKVQSIKGAKLNEKKSFRKELSQILGYHVRLSSFLKIFDNAFPFATISC